MKAPNDGKKILRQKWSAGTEDMAQLGNACSQAAERKLRSSPATTYSVRTY